MDKIYSVTLANKVPTPITRAPFTHFGGGGLSPPLPTPLVLVLEGLVLVLVLGLECLVLVLEGQVLVNITTFFIEIDGDDKFMG